PATPGATGAGGSSSTVPAPGYTGAPGAGPASAPRLAAPGPDPDSPGATGSTRQRPGILLQGQNSRSETPGRDAVAGRRGACLARNGRAPGRAGRARTRLIPGRGGPPGGAPGHRDAAPG